MRLWPRSLLGQVMVALAAALVVAQGISVILLYRAAEQRREIAIMHAAAFQLLAGDRRAERREGREIDRPRMRRPAPPEGGSEPFRLPRRLRYSESPVSPVRASEIHDGGREDALRSILASQGVTIDRLDVTSRPFMQDPMVRAAASRFPLMHAAMRDLPHDLMIVGLKQQGSDNWQVARVPVPPRDRAIVRTLVLQTLILFAILFGLLYVILRRITGPLHALAERTARFAGAGSAEAPLPATGPEDVRRLIAAHNAMQARIGSMLDEKDVMLGAIGHDLKTPLAALRVRIESVEDEAARAKMAASIDDITCTLDEILALARIGKGNGAPERTDIGALAASVVEEFEDMGEDVALSVDGRVVAPVQITWLKRGLRNLVANALRYAGSARVTVLHDDGMVVLRVDDDGPGIPDDRIQEMLQPFTRGEASRNRETGGSGLGLTLARAVAEQHGGKLLLGNRPEGGLRVELRLPA